MIGKVQGLARPLYGHARRLLPRTDENHIRGICRVTMLLLAASTLCQSEVHATVRNVESYGAKGDGTTNDTAAIGNAIAALQPGDTLLFPVQPATPI